MGGTSVGMGVKWYLYCSRASALLPEFLFKVRCSAQSVGTKLLWCICHLGSRSELCLFSTSARVRSGQRKGLMALGLTCNS